MSLPPLTLHEYAPSGNCYKIRLVAAHLGLPLARRHYDIVAGETRTRAFLEGVSPAGRIPVLQVGDRFLAESNAACWFLGEGSALVPADRFARAEMLRWMFFEQYSHEPNIATLRFWLRFLGEDAITPDQRAQMPAKRAGGAAALALMERRLDAGPFLVGETATLADLVLYAYTHVADEGGFALDDHPAVSAWLGRVAALPGHVPIEA